MSQLAFLLLGKPHPLPETPFTLKPPQRHYVKDGFKWCNYCCENKPVSEFYMRHRMGGQYLNSKCKKCQIKLAVENKREARKNERK